MAPLHSKAVAMAQGAERSPGRTRRLALLAVVALALSPGLLWRSSPHENAGPRPLAIRSLDLPEGASLAPGLTVAGGWELDSTSESFGGYSALLVMPEDGLLAFSDRGWFLRFGKPTGPAVPPLSGPVGTVDSNKRMFDIESATRDPATGRIWLGYESLNMIRRTGPDLGNVEGVKPEAMRNWLANSGPESLVRLSDGRFIVIAEAVSDGPQPHCEGLLFPDDPVDGAKPASFRFVPPEGFRPTDIAQLPDGRVVILLRGFRFGFPPLSSRLVIADPATIEPGKDWNWETLAEIREPLPHENYEGIAVEPREDGTVRLWVISDDNGAAFQRTLLLALDWTSSPRK